MDGSRKFATKNAVTYYLVLGVLLSFLFGAFGSIPTATAQHPPRPLTPVTYIQCPGYPISGKFPITLHASVSVAEDDLKNIVYKWNVSQASILSGQGTKDVVLAPSVKSAVSELKVNLEVEGGPPELVYQASCTFMVDPECSLAPIRDQYSVVSLDEERQHLDRFAQQLKAGPVESIAYLVSYAGRRSCLNESEWRAKRAAQYLVTTHGIPASRVVTVEGGFKENWTIELYTQPRRDCGPLPNPTLTISQVHIEGYCDGPSLQPNVFVPVRYPGAASMWTDDLLMISRITLCGCGSTVEAGEVAITKSTELRRNASAKTCWCFCNHLAGRQGLEPR